MTRCTRVFDFRLARVNKRPYEVCSNAEMNENHEIMMTDLGIQCDSNRYDGQVLKMVCNATTAPCTRAKQSHEQRPKQPTTGAPIGDRKEKW